VVTVSADLRRKVLAMGAAPRTTRAVVNGCNLSVFHPGDRLAARRKLGIDPAVEAIVYIGRMDVRKGLRELVEAAASLHAQRPSLRVYMIGEGPDRLRLESAIRVRNAAAYIHALPACAFDEVAVWVAAANLVTLPSYMEGCPNVILEALACGRPVVATNVGGATPPRWLMPSYRSSTEAGTPATSPRAAAEAGRRLRQSCLRSSNRSSRPG
jgi:glycosyltransferase involved in cell wall biosynthesis